MYDYDIRRQIKAENKNRLFGEIVVLFILIVLVFYVIYGNTAKNPFQVLNITDKGGIEEAYASGNIYVKVNQADLEYSGYYLKNKKGEVKYNCYTLEEGDKKYYVFINWEQSGVSPEKPDQWLKNYKIKAQLKKDERLFQMAAEDNHMTAEQYKKTFGYSSIILDEARSNQFKQQTIWILFIILLLIICVYIILLYIRSDKTAVRKELKKFGDAEEVERLFDRINKEVAEYKLFDSNNIKITKNWILGFYKGIVAIIPRKDINQISKKEKVIKQYGFIKMGCENKIEVQTADGNRYILPTEYAQDCEEIMNILTKKNVEKDNDEAKKECYNEEE